MSPERTFGKQGSYRFDEYVPGVGRIRRKSGARTLTEHNRRVALIRKLRDQGRNDLLLALMQGTIRVPELLDADRQNRLPFLVADVFLRRPLWASADQALDRAKAAPATVQTYRVSWRALQTAGVLPREAKVSDLLKVDWRALEAKWGRSGTSWNHLRRAVSRTLTLILGSHWHPLRAKVLADFPVRPEVERMPELSPQDFRRVVRVLEEPVRPPIMLLAITGMRLGEYRKLTPAHLGKHVISIPKAKGDPRRIPVDPKLWGWVKAAVPCPVSDWTLRTRWKAAQTKARLPEYIRLHDLRHCTAQWLHDAGRPLASLKELLGHKTLAMTERYARRRLRLDDAAAMAAILGNPQVDPHLRKRGRRHAV